MAIWKIGGEKRYALVWNMSRRKIPTMKRIFPEFEGILHGEAM